MSRELVIQYADPKGSIIRKPGVGILVAAGTTVPTDGAAGFAPGCVFQDTDASAGSTLYVNEGTATSADFNKIVVDGGTITALTVTTLTATTANITTANLTTVTQSAGLVSLTPTRTVASAADANLKGISAAATTITLTGGTQVTEAQGFLNLGRPTLTDASAVTVDTYATLYIANSPTTGGMVTLTSAYALWVDAGVTRLDGNVNVAAAAWDLIGIANTAAAIEITDGTTAFIALDTRNTVTVQNIILQGPAAQTLPNGATSRARIVTIPAKTITLLGTTQVTTENLGVQLCIDAPTIAQSGGAVTVDRVSTLHVGTPVAGSMVTITANHLISTGTSGCFCTAAGAWTDTSARAAKMDFQEAKEKDILDILDRTEVVRFRYKDGSDGRILRIGGIAEDVPEELSMPGLDGQRNGIAARDVAWMALAAAKVLREQLDKALKKIAKLEAA